MADTDACQGRDEAADLLWAPLLIQPADNGSDHARQVLRPLPGGTTPLITEHLSLLGIVATRGGVTAQLKADGAVMDAKLSGDLPLAQVMAGVDLLSLDLGQLSVSHALLHFGR
jgi:hypothetical protein